MPRDVSPLENYNRPLKIPPLQTLAANRKGLFHPVWRALKRNAALGTQR
jgi:hypothetical protein